MGWQMGLHGRGALQVAEANPLIMAVIARGLLEGRVGKQPCTSQCALCNAHTGTIAGMARACAYVCNAV